MANNFPSTHLIGNDIFTSYRGELDAYSQVIAANNDKLYFVPFRANKVMSFDVKNNEWNYIGDDLGHNYGKWNDGVIENGKIFCSPSQSNDILIIDTNTDTTKCIRIPTELQNQDYKYTACSSDKNGNVYFFPQLASNILKININTNEVTILKNIHCGNNWWNAVHASNELTYVLSTEDEIMKFNPNDLSFVKAKLSIDSIDVWMQYNDWIEHKDGHLYTIPLNGSKVMKVNMTTLSSTTVGNDLGNEMFKWGSSVLGKDNCIYGIPYNTGRVIRFDPLRNTITMVGEEYDGEHKWCAGCLAADGNIYAAPSCAKKVLKINIARWELLKCHIMLRCLLEQGRASALKSDGTENSCYQRLIQHLNDDVFRMVLQFL